MLLVAEIPTTIPSTKKLHTCALMFRVRRRQGEDIGLVYLSIFTGLILTAFGGHVTSDTAFSPWLVGWLMTLYETHETHDDLLWLI